MRLPGVQGTRMCLRARDGISQDIRVRGRYFDCAALSELWRQQRGGREGIFLELGGNIGACTLEMLLLTNATIIVFEPNPISLFFLTSSVRLAVKQHARRLEQRVWVFPYAAGAAAARASIFSARGNGGNAIVNVAVRDWGKHRQTFDQLPIEVRPLDLLFPRGLEVHLLKMDIQGSECRALEGMQRMLQRTTIHSLHTELSEKHLRALGCNGSRLLALIGEHFNVSAPPVMQHSFGHATGTSTVVATALARPGRGTVGARRLVRGWRSLA